MKAQEFVKEGADFLAYYKDGDTWKFPDGFKTQTPHRSNMAVRQFLSKLGYDPDFENEGPMEINDFIAKTGQMEMDKEAQVYNQEATRIKQSYPDLTHVAFA